LIDAHGLLAADRREGQSWRPRQRLKNDLIYALISATTRFLGMLPARMLRALGRGIGRLAYLVFASARRTARANVARALPALPAASQTDLARRCYVELGQHLGDAVALLGGARFVPLALDAPSVAVLDAARSEGRGVVFVSAHLGPWERVAGSLVLAGFPLTTVAREAYDARLTRLYDRLRGSLGVKVVYRAAPGAAGRLLRALKSGHLLGLPMDLRSRVASVDAPFLGHAAPTAIGPARIALRTGAPVVVGTVARGPGGRLLVSATRIRTHDLTATPEAEIELTRRLNDELSTRILSVPDQWVWMHPRWSDGPADAPGASVASLY
jgi:KDO2-lipid IV(A) lauroyltransferase